MNKIKLLSLAGLLASASPAFAAMPPAPGSHTITLADGSHQQVTIRGQFGLHWYETADGAAIVRDPQRNDGWYYAELNQHDPQRPIKVSDTLVSLASQAPQASYFDASNLPAILNNNGINLAKLNEIQLQQSVKANRASAETLLQRQAIKARTAANRNAQVEQPLLVVQVSFTDQVMVHDFTQRIFASDTQSTVDYFLKNSFNRYKVVPAKESEGNVNDGVINVSVNQAHPNCNRSSTCTDSLNSVFQEAYTQLDPYINLAQYDNNNDGQIAPDELSVMFVFAGNDMSGSTITPAIWPHQSEHQNATLDNVTIDQYCLFGDFQNDHQSTLGVIVHELGHLMLGLPDLYSYHNQGSIGKWGLMAGGSWAQKPGDLYAGDTPVNMTIWSKQAAGFLTPRVLNSSGTQQINTLDDGAIVYLDPYLKTVGPRLYIENRRQQGYDQALPAEGVLITSVDTRQPFNDSSPMQVQVLQADDLNELGWQNGRTDSGDLFPGSTNNTHLSDLSSPSLMDIYGSNTNVTIDAINSNSDMASFTLAKQGSSNKTAWYTSLERNYIYRDHQVNVVAFVIETSAAFNQLAGIDYFTSADSAMAPVKIKLTRYPYTTSPMALDLNAQAGDIIWQGPVNQASGRLMLPDAYTLPSTKSILVMEVTQGKLELTPLYANSYIQRLYELKTNWIGTSTELNAGGITQYNLITVPFAALLEADSSAFVNANADRYTLAEDSSLQLDLLSNDFIQLGYPTRTITVLTQPSKGQFDAETGLYQANPDAHGQDTFSYQIELSNGVSSNEAEVTVQIQPVNDDPIAVDDHASQPVNTKRTLAVLANDQDIDGDTLSVTRLVSAPQHGKATIMNNGNGIEFDSQLATPMASGAQQQDHFSYEVSDGKGGLSIARVNVVIEGPIATPTPVPTVTPTVPPVVTPSPTILPTLVPKPEIAAENSLTEASKQSSGGGGGSVGIFSLLASLLIYRLRRS